MAKVLSIRDAMRHRDSLGVNYVLSGILQGPRLNTEKKLSDLGTRRQRTDQAQR